MPKELIIFTCNDCGGPCMTEGEAEECEERHRRAEKKRRKAPHWTTEPPTEGGVYWAYTKIFNEVRVAEVSFDEEEIYVAFPDTKGCGEEMVISWWSQQIEQPPQP